MKKAANAGGCGYPTKSTVSLQARQRARSQFELQLIAAGLSHTDAQLLADEAIKRGLTFVLDLVPLGSWTATAKRDSESARSVSKNRRDAFSGGWPETKSARRPVHHTGSLDKGGNR